MNSPHKGPVTRKMFPFDDVIMVTGSLCGKPPVDSLNKGLVIRSIDVLFFVDLNKNLIEFCFLIFNVPFYSLAKNSRHFADGSTVPMGFM